MENDDYKNQKYIAELRNTFSALTDNFDLNDWRTVRNEYYWESDSMAQTYALQHKIKLVKYYIKNGSPLTENSYE